MITVSLRNISDLKPYEHNPKIHTKKQIANIAESIRRFGFRNPILIDSDGTIVAGHGRYEAAKEAGMQEVPCILVDDLSPEQIRAFRVLDNKLAESAWDFDILNMELPEIDVSGFDLKWMADMESPAELTEKNEVPKLHETDIRHGDMFRLGEHILLCGDATCEGDVLRLMDGCCANLLLTDPPYNCDYHGSAGSIMNDAMPDDRFRVFLADAFRNAAKVMAPGAAFYIWYASGSSYEFHGALRDVGLKERQVLVWVKNRMILSRQDFNWQDEFCIAGSADVGGEDMALYGWTDGAPHKFYKSAKQSTVLFFDAPTKSKDHPTMKPLDMIGYQVQCSTRRGDVVLDMFAGSGTTLIACEKLGRSCRAMELDPKYCRVIIERWQNETGLEAVKL